MQERSGHAHKPSTGAGCSDDPQPNQPLEFGATALKDDITAIGRGTTNYTLALSTRRSDGSGEGTTSWWKKFDPAASKLTVEYNTPPNTPTAALMRETADYHAPEQPCATGTSRPVVRSVKPWLKVKLTDPDGSKGGLLAAAFTLQRWNGTAWVAVPGWPRNKASVTPNGDAEIQVLTGVATGDRLRWRVVASDTLGGSSDPSTFCEFDLDKTGPTQHPGVAPADGLYPESTSADDNLHGSMGLSGRFTFTANGLDDVYDYQYQVNDSGGWMTATAPAPGGSVTVWVTPNRLGDNTLSVHSRDKAGNPSEDYDYTFLVNEGSAPTAVWNLDEGSGDTLATSPSGGPSLHLEGGPTWTDDRVLGTSASTGRARAVQFNGSTESADAAAPLLDTSRSFTVSAWVRLSKVDATYQTVMSQEGSYTSAFFLQATPSGNNHWRFVRHTSDNAATGWVAASSISPQVVGVWTHLAGVYDPGTQEIRLYVNGVLEGYAGYAPSSAWNAAGPTHLARAKTGGTPADFLGGTIGAARVWNRVVDPRIDLAPLVEPVPVGVWEMEDFDDEAPRQVSDESGYDRSLTLGGTTQWGEGLNFSGALIMDGLSGSAATDGQVLRTDQSFSVAVWVRRDSATGSQTVWGQDGVVNSAAYLRYQDNYPGGAWVFAMRTKDDSTGAQVAAFNVGTTNAWTHLVATYDAQTAQLVLYVNGVPAAPVTYRATWDATGPFTAGRLKYLSAPVNYWNGALDRLRVWQGTLTADQVTALYAEP